MTINFAEQIQKDIENGFNVHNKYKEKTVEELKNICSSESLPYAVCAVNFTGDLNTGVVLRAASIMGARDFILFGRTKYDKRSTVGAQNYIPNFIKINGLKEDLSVDIDKFEKMINDGNYFPIFVETDGCPINEIQWDYMEKLYPNKIPCFIFGNESFGIPYELINRFNDRMIVSIPQMGVLRSLNVSSAASILLWDYVKTVHWSK